MSEMTLREHLLIASAIFRKYSDNAELKKRRPDYPVRPIAFMCDAHGNWD
jgi:hypothetical protein